MMKRLAVAAVAVLVLGWAAPAGAQIETFKDCNICPELVVIPAGDFVMGSPSSERGRDSDEGPRHPVSIRQAFALGRFEVTRGEFAAFVAESGHATRASGCDTRSGSPKTWRNPGFVQTDRDPVVCVSWRDAKAYVIWLSRKTGLQYRLPSEAEWEYAARGGTTTARHWGQGAGSNRANCDGCGSRWDDRQTAPVGSFAANPFGLHDMLGNSREWVEDCYVESFRGAPNDGRARSGGGCAERVMRGGSWESSRKRVRAANRNGHGELALDNDFGFRVVRTLSNKAFERIFRAAEGGDPTALYNLGRLYEIGYGVPRDPQEATRWYREAAAKGSPEAQAALQKTGLPWATGAVRQAPATSAPPAAATPLPWATGAPAAPAPAAPPIAAVPAVPAAPAAPPIAAVPTVPAVPAAPAAIAPPVVRAPAPEAPPIGGAAQPTALPALPELPDLPKLGD